MPGIESFDKNVDRYESWFIENPLAYVSELHAVRALLPKGSGAEIGVGTGRFAAPLGIGKGVEPSRSMAEVARKKGVEVASGVAEHLPYVDGEFDFCLMVTTVCFLDDMAMAFREVHRVLRQGGKFLVGFVDRESRLGLEYQGRKDRSPFYKDATFYSVAEILAAMTEARLRDFEFRQTLFKPLDELVEIEPVREGHGEGAFVVVRGTKV
jgi:SAM-dependent methyltransferase